MRIIAFHLPQFHTFKENDEWWGIGFTEWTNTKKSIPLFKGHVQPREPLDDYYYDLSEISSLRWQVNLAKKYGIYGFCFYHYWFGDDHILMQKPIELFLKNPDLDMPFCISWANETWSRTWNGSDKDYLIKQDYGNEETWRRHFFYLLPYFKDKRYIAYKNKPLFILYKPEIFPDYKKMFSLWDTLAKKNGLEGLSFGVQGAIWNNIENADDSAVDLRILYEPGFTGSQHGKNKSLEIRVKSKLLQSKNLFTDNHINFQSYDAFCKNIVHRKVFSDKMVPGMFVSWDNTPRKGKNSTIFLGSTPDKFEKYLSILASRIQKKEYPTDMLFLNAWNEWAEGCMLEPDKKNGYEYLEAIRKVLGHVDQ